MKFEIVLLIAFYFISQSFEAPPKTIFIAGDSTADANGGHNGKTEGWGKHLGKYVSSAVNNQAVAGFSSRTFGEMDHGLN